LNPNTSIDSNSKTIIIAGIVLVLTIMSAAAFYYYFYYYLRNRPLFPFLFKSKHLVDATMEQLEDVVIGGDSLDEKPLLA